MQTVEKNYLGTDENGAPVYNRVIFGKVGETKPTGMHEEILLRQGDVYIEYGENSSAVAYTYDPATTAWIAM